MGRSRFKKKYKNLPSFKENRQNSEVNDLQQNSAANDLQPNSAANDLQIDVRRFCPPDITWQREICHDKAFTQYPNEVRYGVKNVPLAAPLGIKKIIGDGNCLYRSISLCSAGTQNYYKRIRQDIFYYELQNKDKVIPYLWENETFEQHMANTQTNHKEGKDVDVFVAAAYLNTTIFVWQESPAGSNVWDWHRYGPEIMTNHGTQPKTGALFLKNTNSDHFDVVTSVELVQMPFVIDNEESLFHPLDIEQQILISRQLGFNHFQTVEYNNTGGLLSPSFIQFETNAQLNTLYHAVVYSFTGCYDDSVHLREKLIDFMDNNWPSVAVHLQEGESLKNHFKRMCKVKAAADVDIISLAAFLKVDIWLFDSMSNDKTNLTRSWRCYSSESLLGTIDSRQCIKRGSIYVTRHNRGYALVHEMTCSQKEKISENKLESLTANKCDECYSDRREYWRDYKRKRSVDPDFLESDKLRKQAVRDDPERGPKLASDSRQYKQSTRADPERGPKLASDSRQYKQSTRADPERGPKLASDSRQYKQSTRADPERGPKLASYHRQYEKATRADPERGPKLASDSRQYKQSTRADPERGPKLASDSRQYKQSTRADPERGPKLASDSRQYKKATRADPEHGPKVASDSIRYKKATRADPKRGPKLANYHRQYEKATRADPERGPKLASDSRQYKQSTRADPERGPKLASDSRQYKKATRADPERAPKLASDSRQYKQTARSDQYKGPELRKKDTELKRNMNKCPGNRQLKRISDRLSKIQSRSSPAFSEYEKAANRAYKRKSTDCESNVNSSPPEKIKRMTGDIKTLQDCINEFLTRSANGPLYVCSICHQTWFQHSVQEVTENMRIKDAKNNQCFTGYISFDGKEWICSTCYSHLSKNKLPKFSTTKNGLSFPKIPPQLVGMHPLEERIISPYIPFMQIFECPRGGQIGIRGNVVNVPNSVMETITSLPRNISDTQTIPVKLKRRKCYKTAPFHENIRPVYCVEALLYLIEHSELWNNITLDDEWMERIRGDSSNFSKEVVENSSCTTNDVSENEDDSHTDNSTDEFSEIEDSEKVSGNTETMLDNNDDDYTNKTLIIAPGENQRPTSLYQNPNAEYMSFPSIYAGEVPLDNSERRVKVTYSELCKWECRHVDRRVAKSVPNLLFKLKKKQLQQLSQKKGLSVRRIKGNNREFTAGDVKSDGGEGLVKLNDGFHIFKTMTNSPAYLEKRKNDVFAMIRQLGIPTFFISLSAADTKWEGLLKALAKQHLNKDLTDEGVHELTWQEKSNLLRNDPVMCARYFDNRTKDFIKNILMSEHNPIGPVEDSFYRVEFQQRGSPHIHALIWIKDAPTLDKNSEEEIVNFIDKYISCSADVPPELNTYLSYQTHRHSKTCRKKGKAICRFNYPIPPMRKTCILEPLSDISDEEKTAHKETYNKIAEKLVDLSKQKNIELTFDQFLGDLDINENDYNMAIQFSLKRRTVFLKRNPNEIRTNAYMKNLLSAWQANHDIQFVLDPYACAVYILSYMTKSTKGMSELMALACKDANRLHATDIKKRVQLIGNKFLNCNETCSQEAAYIVLQMPITKSSRKVIFVPTSPPEERTYLLKNMESLNKLDDDSTDIASQNQISRYASRPKKLENICLADYLAKLNFTFKKKPNQNEDDTSEPDHDQDEVEDNVPVPLIHCEDDPDYEWKRHLPMTLRNGTRITLRRKPAVLRPIHYNPEIDAEKFYRESLMLYTNWRDEARDFTIDGSFQEQYENMIDSIKIKRDEYDKLGKVLDDAAQEAMNENRDNSCNAFDDIAPGTEQCEAEDRDAGRHESEEHRLFLPSNKRQQVYDIGNEFNANYAENDDDVEIRTKRLPLKDYLQGVRSLNKEQREFFTHVLHLIKTKSSPFNYFLTGGAGVGKTVVVRLLWQAIDSYLSKDPGQTPDKVRVLLIAPTGKAAFNIKGSTIHSAFSILPNRGFKQDMQMPLTDERLNTLRVKYQDLSTIIIDECSMVGNRMLVIINERLKQIMGNDKLFGGVNVIFVGDLFQLKPVLDGWIFKQPGATKDKRKQPDYEILGPNLWKDNVYMYELTTIMRQREDTPFAESLNRIREGNHTKDDIDMLHTRIVPPGSHIELQHLCGLNADVCAHNQRIFETAKDQGAEWVTVRADDLALTNSDVAKTLRQRIRESNEVRAGLSTTVDLCVGLKYDICINIDVEDGLLNGAPCTLKKLDYRSNTSNVPHLIWVEFDLAEIGRNQRVLYANYLHERPDIIKGWTPIFAARREYNYNRYRFARIQFPVRQSAAKTFHRAQGDTLSSVVVDHTTWHANSPHTHYVAFSRVTKLENLYILNLNSSKVNKRDQTCNKKTSEKKEKPEWDVITIDSDVKTEMDELRTERRLQLCYIPVYTLPSTSIHVVFQNARSLHAHFEDIAADPNFIAADVIGIAESRLFNYEKSSRYNLPRFNLVRCDQPVVIKNCRPPHGIAVYLKVDIEIEERKQYSSKECEWFYLRLNTHKGILQYVVIYADPDMTWRKFYPIIHELVQHINPDIPTFVVGDFNHLAEDNNLTTFLSDNRNFTQLIDEVTTDYDSKLDLVFTNRRDVSSAGVIEMCWTDHKLLWSSITSLFN